MASDRAILKVVPRSEFGSRNTRRLRRSGFVPGIVYASGSDARPFQVPAREVENILSAGHALFDLEIEGSGAVPVVVKEQQVDPVRGHLRHFDCMEVKLDEAIESDVPLELLGTEEAPGVVEGGVLEHVTREITVEALPTEIPDAIYADVSGMVIGDTLQLSGVTPPEGVKFAAEDPEEVTVATLSPPRIEEEPEPDLEEEAELIGEDGEPIEREEGEEGEEGEGDGEAEGEEKPEGDGDGGKESSGDGE